VQNITGLGRCRGHTRKDGFEDCVPDDTKKLPTFRLLCQPDKQDATARIDLLFKQKDAVLSDVGGKRLSTAKRRNV